MKEKLINKIREINKVLINLGVMFKFSWKVSKSRFFVASVYMIINSVTPFLFLILPKYILDELGGEKRWDVVLKYIAIFIAVTAMVKFFDWGFWFLQGKMQLKASLKNDKVYLDLSLYMDYKNMEDSEVKDLGEKVKNNINSLKFVDRIISGFVTEFFQLIGYTYIIAQLHPLIIVAILIIIWFNSKLSQKREKLGYDFQPVIANFTRKYEYIYSSMIGFDSGKDIRINKASEWLKSKYSAETNEYIRHFIIKQNKEFKLTLIDYIIAALQTVIMYGYSVYMTITGKITIGSFSVYLGAITNFTSSFSGFISKFVEIKYYSYLVDDYKKYLEFAKPSYLENVNKNTTEKDLKNSEIEFINVSFKYPNTEKYVLKNISLKIRQGEKLSIVGYNGAGKSTFIKLICRLYEPTEGKILYNGIDIFTIDNDIYRNLMSLVFQDYQLFAFSVEENIVLSKKWDKRKLQWAIEKSGLSDKLSTLPNGLETSISKEFDSEGIEFSGGEGQKLACARAYYKDCPVVILDEPTASLDPIAESQLYERFNNIISNNTAIYISHRLASAKFCDNIAVFVDGEIVEYGNHDLLMREKGIYEKMFSMQSEYYKKEAAIK